MRKKKGDFMFLRRIVYRSPVDNKKNEKKEKVKAEEEGSTSPGSKDRKRYEKRVL